MQTFCKISEVVFVKLEAIIMRHVIVIIGYQLISSVIKETIFMSLITVP